MRSMFEALGMVGIWLSVVTNLAQVRHVAKEHHSAGIRPRELLH